jgi:peptidoglycan/LPS O-acetylase OafA/YrhL
MTVGTPDERDAESAAAGSHERARLEEHRRLGYRPQLDGIRALAILPVVTFHAWDTPRGGLFGVDIFFVLSGFLITTLLLGEWQASGRISLPHFYLRRALRLLPALFVAVAGYLVIAGTVGAFGVPFSRALRGAGYGVLYVSNIMIAIGTDTPAAIGHLWSLATEEQFYLVWPLALLLVLCLGASRRLLVFGLIVAIAALTAHRSELLAGGVSVTRIYYAPDGHFDQLLIGCLAGVWFATGTLPALLRSQRFLRVAAPVAVVIVAGMFFLPYLTKLRVLNLLTVFGAAVAVLIIAVLANPHSLIARVLALAPLVFIGKISYALYLWHPILIYGLAGLPRIAEVALAFAVATISYYLIELPFLRLTRRDRARIDADTSSAETIQEAWVGQVVRQ